MDRRLVWFCVLLAPVLGWSAIAPHDTFTWFLEVLPIFIGLPIALACSGGFHCRRCCWCCCGCTA